MLLEQQPQQPQEGQLPLPHTRVRRHQSRPLAEPEEELLAPTATATRSFIAGSQLPADASAAGLEEVSFVLGAYSTPAPTPLAKEAARPTTASKRLSSQSFSEELAVAGGGSSSIWTHDSIG